MEATSKLAREKKLVLSEEIKVHQDLCELLVVMTRHRDLRQRLANMQQVGCSDRDHFYVGCILEKQKQAIMGRLKHVYPITLSDSYYSICRVRLSRDVYAHDDEHVSSALGYVCHTTLLLSKYLQVTS